MGSWRSVRGETAPCIRSICYTVYWNDGSIAVSTHINLETEHAIKAQYRPKRKKKTTSPSLFASPFKLSALENEADIGVSTRSDEVVKKPSEC